MLEKFRILRNLQAIETDPSIKIRPRASAVVGDSLHERIAIPSANDRMRMITVLGRPGAGNRLEKLFPR
ncbi:MAG: hypothetical protein AB9828_02060 [Sphaerochaetaceae bacterium]